MPLGAILGLGGAALTAALTARSQRRQQELNRQMFDEQKLFARQGVQIRAQDLQQAGLSKTLAAGSAASTTAQAQASNVADEGLAMERAMNMGLAMSQLTKTRAETGLTEALQNKAQQESALTSTHNATAQLNLRIKRATADFDIQKAMAESAIAKSKINTELYNQLNTRMDSLLKGAQIRGTHRENLLKNATLQLMQIERKNRQWYHDMGVPYDIGWDVTTRAATMFVAAISEKIKAAKNKTTTRPLTSEERNQVLSGDYQF